jgi:hypothetical protein
MLVGNTSIIASPNCANIGADSMTMEFARSLLAAVSVTGFAAQADAQPAQSAFASRILAAHNNERLRVGVPPLQWDERLAVSAARYGPTLAALGRLQHSPRAQRPGERENLWMGQHSRFTLEQMVGGWIAERRLFRPGIFPNVSLTGDWYDVGHYTQLVWRTTTRVGCALQQTQANDYLICRYSPPGNIDGRPVF